MKLLSWTEHHSPLYQCTTPGIFYRSKGIRKLRWTDKRGDGVIKKLCFWRLASGRISRGECWNTYTHAHFHAKIMYEIMYNKRYMCIFRISHCIGIITSLRAFWIERSPPPIRVNEKLNDYWMTFHVPNFHVKNWSITLSCIGILARRITLVILRKVRIQDYPSVHRRLSWV